MNKLGLFCLSATCLFSPLAAAHTPYMVPNAFEPINGGLITLDASFATYFFIPEVYFTDGEDFEVRGPDGGISEPDTVLTLRSRNVIEHDLTEEGTYRFSTGRRLGMIFRIYTLPNGERFIPRGPGTEGPGLEVPQGAELTEHYQTNTIAETFVTRGAPSDAALAPRGDGLEFVPVTHPNDLFVGEAMELQALYYGVPMAGLAVEVFPASKEFNDDQPGLILTSGSHGEVVFAPEQPGVYLLRSRYRDVAPPESEAPEMSHTYTLVVEAFE